MQGFGPKQGCIEEETALQTVEDDVQEIMDSDAADAGSAMACICFQSLRRTGMSVWHPSAGSCCYCEFCACYPAQGKPSARHAASGHPQWSAQNNIHAQESERPLTTWWVCCQLVLQPCRCMLHGGILENFRSTHAEGRLSTLLHQTYQRAGGGACPALRFLEKGSSLQN